jgi:hypothetical protein
VSVDDRRNGIVVDVAVAGVDKFGNGDAYFEEHIDVEIDVREI